MIAKKYKRRNYPQHPLEDALAVGQKIADERAGMPFKRLLLADALGLKPSSTNFRDMLSSSYKYGLTEGTQKATDISLTDLGKRATSGDVDQRRRALREAALSPPLFRRFFDDYADKKLPSQDLLPKLLHSDYGVPEEWSSECAEIIMQNGRFAHLVRDIGGSPHVLLDSDISEYDEEPQDVIEEDHPEEGAELEDEQHAKIFRVPDGPAAPDVEAAVEPRPIFIGHGKNRDPLQRLEKFLSSFQIPYKVTMDEAHLGRPIPQKVKDTMAECGSAIIIFTRDERFYDGDGNELWRPSENVVYELGAASFLYGDRIVIFKESGLYFPANFQSIGYIEFEVDSIDAKTSELLKELIGFGLVKVTPT